MSMIANDDLNGRGEDAKECDPLVRGANDEEGGGEYNTAFFAVNSRKTSQLSSRVRGER